MRGFNRRYRCFPPKAVIKFRGDDENPRRSRVTAQPRVQRGPSIDGRLLDAIHEREPRPRGEPTDGRRQRDAARRSFFSLSRSIQHDSHHRVGRFRREREGERENGAFDAPMRGRRKSSSRAGHIPGRHVGSGANGCHPLAGERGENARFRVNAPDLLARSNVHCTPRSRREYSPEIAPSVDVGIWCNLSRARL